MTQTKTQEPMDKAQNDPAFEIVEVNTATGEVTLVIKKGIIGPLSNQLKNTSSKRKAHSILRKLGYMVSDTGDILYGTKTVEETEINPDLVTDEIYENED